MSVPGLLMMEIVEKGYQRHQIANFRCVLDETRWSHHNPDSAHEYHEYVFVLQLFTYYTAELKSWEGVPSYAADRNTDICPSCRLYNPTESSSIQTVGGGVCRGASGVFVRPHHQLAVR